MVLRIAATLGSESAQGGVVETRPARATCQLELALVFRRLRPGFVELPLDLTDEFAITLLASTISLTPGTVSADVSEDRRTLLIHALDVDDQDAMIRQIKQRYERPLKEIFEC